MKFRLPLAALAAAFLFADGSSALADSGTKSARFTFSYSEPIEITLQTVNGATLSGAFSSLNRQLTSARKSRCPGAQKLYIQSIELNGGSTAAPSTTGKLPPFTGNGRVTFVCQTRTRTTTTTTSSSNSQ